MRMPVWAVVIVVLLGVSLAVFVAVDVLVGLLARRRCPAPRPDSGVAAATPAPERGDLTEAGEERR